MKKTWLKYLLLIVGSILCIAYSGYSFVQGKRLDNDKICKGIEISILGNQHQSLVNAEEITDFLDEKKMIPSGKFYSKIKAKSIEEEVNKHPMVRNAECYKTSNGILKIEIEQRIPILRIVGTENYYVDQQRKIIPVSTRFSAYVPVASGNITRAMAKGQVYDFANYIGKDSFWDNQIDQIYVDRDNKVFLIPRVGSHTIALGNFDRYEKKLEKLKKLYLYGFNRIGWNKYKTIDLQYENQVVCTKNDVNQFLQKAIQPN
ncbi:MAG: cell division protein FtsQ/DivIB [Paludibacteraceae bacterium]